MSDQYYKDTNEALDKFENEFGNVTHYLSIEIQNLWSNLVNELTFLLVEHDNNLAIIDQLEEDKMQLTYKVSELDNLDE